MAALLTEADHFYIDETSLDPVARVFRLRGVALRDPASVPDGRLAVFTGSYVQPSDGVAIKMQARETRCRNALGNTAVGPEEQQSCLQFLTWLEQVKTREAQQRQYDQTRNDQLAAQARAEEAMRRQRIAQALRAWSESQAEHQRRNDEERRHQELRQDIQRAQRPLYTRPRTTTTTRCKPDGLGGIRCTTD